MHIGIAGPISSESIAPFIDGDARQLPRGYTGAPLLGTLIGGLLVRGHTITAYTTSNDLPLPKHVTATGDKFKITFCAQRPRSFSYNESYWGRAIDFFKHERAALSHAMQDDAPDLVHAHWTYEFALAAIESGLPNLITCHDAPQVVLKYSPNPYRLVRYFMARRVFKQAKHLTTVSPYLKKMVETYARAPISVVPNPLPKQLPQHSSNRKPFDPAKPHIAMVLNGWGSRKNPQPAIQAFALLRQKIPSARLTIMGADYGVGGKAECWARSQGLAEGVTFEGPQPYSVLLAKLEEADLLLHPALEETFGMSIAEAMSLGVPVVGGRDSGAVPWVIGKGGRIVDVRSPQEIANVMLEILSDAQKLLTRGAAAKESALSRFDVDAVAIAYETEYEQVLSGVGRRC